MAVLNTTAAGRSAVVQEGAEDKGYGNIREIMTALLSGKVQCEWTNLIGKKSAKCDQVLALSLPFF